MAVSRFLHLRDATAADIPALIGLVTSAYRGDASRLGWTTEADLLDGQRIDAERLQLELARPHSRILLAVQADRLCACAHITIGDGAGHFGMFAVAPALQGRGLGKRLLAEAERIVRDHWRQPALRMAVIDLRASLIAFYQRRGYRRTGIHKPFPYGDARFGIPKRDDLRFEILEKTFLSEPRA